MFVGLHVHFTQVCTMFVAIISFVEIGQSSSKYIGIVENNTCSPPSPLNQCCTLLFVQVRGEIIYPKHAVIIIED